MGAFTLGRARPNACTNCTLSTLLYPTRTLIRTDARTTRAHDTQSSETTLMDPLIRIAISTVSEAFSGGDIVPNNNAINSVFSALWQPPSSATMPSPSQAASASSAETAVTIVPVLVTTTSPATTPVTQDTVTAAASSGQTESSTTANPACKGEPDCVTQPSQEGQHRGVIAGSVIAVVTLAVIVFAAFMCYRRRHGRRSHHKPPTWKEIEEAEKAEMSTISKKEVRRSVTSERGQIYTGKATTDLSEPPPASSTRDDDQEMRPATLYLDNGHRYTISNTSSATTASNPFATPTNLSQDASSLEAGHPTQSQIGLALSRYSTNQAKHTCSQLKTADQSDLEKSPPQPQVPRRVPQPLQDPRVMSHKRASSVSAVSDIQDLDDVVVVCKARAVPLPRARRVSVPQAFDIIHSSSRSDSGNTDSQSISAKTTGGRHARARSASPARILEKYTGSQSKLDSHFRFKKFETSAGDRDSRGILTSTEDASSLIDQTGSRQPSTRSDGGRIAHMSTVHDASYPPSSYPGLGRTMSEAKRKLREQSRELVQLNCDKEPSDRSDTVPMLPDSVTVRRGHGQ